MMESKSPTISVITATYNAAATLPHLIESLRGQDDRDFEWIVVDGASTDDTVDILRGCGDIVTKWISEPDFGIYDALNRGLRLASSEYYLVIGADDKLFANAIKDFREAANKSQADIVTADVLMNGKLRTIRKGPTWMFGASALISAHAAGTIFKKQLHERFGMYSRKFPIAADSFFVKQVCLSGVKPYHAQFVAGEFGTGGISSADVAGILSEFFRVQLLTERSKLLQLMIYVMRLLKHWNRLG